MTWDWNVVAAVAAVCAGLGCVVAVMETIVTERRLRRLRAAQDAAFWRTLESWQAQSRERGVDREREGTS
jgi:heme/copper-type cytochrome/quinol oxidase subunit 1